MANVIIDDSLCIGCGVCVDSCPNDVLELVDGITKVMNSDKCEGCGICEAMCTKNAIEMKDEISSSQN